MDKPYFLTPNNATLLDHCEREIKSHAGLCLVRGGKGVGKTRLLQELVRDRIDARVRWMDLAAGDEDPGALVDSSELIEKTFARAKPGDVIIADHFERALKKSRHQLFLSWSTEGIDKQLGLVIGSHDEALGELRQLAQHYQVRVESFTVKPFTAEEVEAFLDCYLFPDRSPGRLDVPPLLRRQLDAAQGDLNRVIGIAERAGDQVARASRESSETKDGVESRRSPRRALLAAALAAVMMLGGMAWYLFDANGRAQPAVADRVANQPGVPRVIPSNEALSATAEAALSTGPQPVGGNFTGNDAELPLRDETASDSPVSSDSVADTGGTPARIGDAFESALQPVSVSPEVFEVAPEPVDTAGTWQGTDDRPEDPAADSADDTVAPVTITYYEDLAEDWPEDSPSAENVNPAVPDTIELVALAEPVIGDDRLRQDLDTSLAWVDNRDGATGTLQILLLSKARFDPAAFYDHVNALARDGVDVSQLKILETFTAGRETYSVLYGEYANRLAAAEARAGLVAALRDASPIARSVAGLRAEIRRLDGQN